MSAGSPTNAIQQDDKEDWEIEAAKMKDIYANSYLTIAASGCSNSTEGFLKSRLYKTLELDFEHVPGGTVLARRNLHGTADRSPFQESLGLLSREAGSTRNVFYPQESFAMNDPNFFGTI